MEQQQSSDSFDESDVADQWVAGGTMPDADDTWSVPSDDPDATWPVQR
jgi:hypothetical protein